MRDASRGRSLSLFWFLCATAITHLVFSRLPAPEWWRIASESKPEKSAQDPIVVEKAEDLERQVVQTSRRDQVPSGSDAAAKYLADSANRVQKETRAPIQDRFREARGGASAKRGDVSKEGEEPVPGDRPPDGWLGLGDLLPQLGASPDSLKDMEEGADTLLNTDAFAYASFLNRIANDIYDPWRRYASKAADDIARKNGKLEANEYITRLSVQLTPDGYVTAISVKKSSGIPALDEATKRAFWESEPFENPPHQMFGKEEMAVLPYEFHFHVQSSSFRVLPGVI